MTGSQSEIYASGASPLANENLGGGASAYVSSGKTSYSTTSRTSTKFTVKSNISNSLYLNINITVKNGYILDDYDKTQLSTGAGKTVTKTIKVTGTQRTFEFRPYNSNQAGYTINSCTATKY